MLFWLSKDKSERLKELFEVLFDNHLGFFVAKFELRKGYSTKELLEKTQKTKVL